MPKIESTELTDCQRREVEYHEEHAKKNQTLLTTPFSWDVLQNPSRRWWNAYWQMYAFLKNCELKDKHVLIVGCGFGDDALRIAKLGAKVSAFDLSTDALAIARALAKREGLSINFDAMPAESLRYVDAQFDYIVARDILHHVDIPRAIAEIVRVAKSNAVFVVNEIYSHSITEHIRRSSLVEKLLYPRMKRAIYGSDKPYITEDEKKLTEIDLQQVTEPLQARMLDKHFNFLVTRIVPDRYPLASKMDRILLILLKPVAHYLAGRVLFAARITK
ncbi:MAG: class I SAM-dependent methyltransferase [Methylococcales bacterium]